MADLILGPMRSGKSIFAEKLALSACEVGRPLYVATLPSLPCYSERIAHHQERRRQRWEEMELVDSFSSILYRALELPQPRIVLLDGLISYLSSVVCLAEQVGFSYAQCAKKVAKEYEDFLDGSGPTLQKLIVVSTMQRRHALKRRCTSRDIVALYLNNKLCEITARASEEVWHVEKGRARRKTWREIKKFYGLTMTWLAKEGREIELSLSPI